MEDNRIGALVREVRRRRGLRQDDVARLAGVSHGSVSLLERGHCAGLTLRTVRAIAAALDIRVELLGWWRGGDAERLLSRRHSLLAESVAAFLSGLPDWLFDSEVSFAVYGERGVVDLLAWHPATGHLLVIELKTEFANVGELIGTLDRKVRLARAIAAERGWKPTLISSWVIVSETRTNRRHFAQHETLLRTRFPSDGRQLRSFLAKPEVALAGMSFWPVSTGSSGRPTADRTLTRIRRPRGSGSADAARK
jgi:transcriptional regulator with XRE-family HTH domain